MLKPPPVILKTSLALAAFLSGFSLIHSAQTKSAFLNFSSSDLMVLAITTSVLLWLSAQRKYLEGFVLSGLIGALYFVFLRSGYFQITGLLLLTFGSSLAIGVCFANIPRHLVIPLFITVAASGFVVGFAHGSRHKPLLSGFVALCLCVVGALTRKASDHIGASNVGVLQSARKSAAPLTVFLALYAGCILVFAVLYSAINNSVPLSFRIEAGKLPTGETQYREPNFEELLTFSMALIINSSFANYNNISPAHAGCRVLALLQSFLGIVFFAIYLQMLLAKSHNNTA
jgi:hypothetical protein